MRRYAVPQECFNTQTISVLRKYAERFMFCVNTQNLLFLRKYAERFMFCVNTQNITIYEPRTHVPVGGPVGIRLSGLHNAHTSHARVVLRTHATDFALCVNTQSQFGLDQPGAWGRQRFTLTPVRAVARAALTVTSASAYVAPPPNQPPQNMAPRTASHHTVPESAIYRSA
jgi:hypothetical protein